MSEEGQHEFDFFKNTSESRKHWSSEDSGPCGGAGKHKQVKRQRLGWSRREARLSTAGERKMNCEGAIE